MEMYIAAVYTGGVPAWAGMQWLSSWDSTEAPGDTRWRDAPQPHGQFAYGIANC